MYFCFACNLFVFTKDFFPSPDPMTTNSKSTAERSSFAIFSPSYRRRLTVRLVTFSLVSANDHSPLMESAYVQVLSTSSSRRPLFSFVHSLFFFSCLNLYIYICIFFIFLDFVRFFSTGSLRNSREKSFWDSVRSIEPIWSPFWPSI